MAQSGRAASRMGHGAEGGAQSTKGYKVKGGTMAKFRFQDLEIWGLSIQIADQLFISVDTVRHYIKNIYKKLHVHTQSEAVAKAIRKKII